MAEGLTDKRERTRQEGKCQLCEKKVALAKQFTVHNNLEAGTVKARKNAARKGVEKASHYCEVCKDKRIKQKQGWLDARAKRQARAAA